MADLGELIGGIMSGLNRARRDADVTSAMIAEEYRVNSLLSAVSAPRVRLSEVTIDLPVILSPESDEQMQARRSGSAMTPEGVLQTLVTRLEEMSVPAPVVTEFKVLAEPEFKLLFGDQVRGISGESISRKAQKSLSTAHINVERRKTKQSQPQARKREDGGDDSRDKAHEGEASIEGLPEDDSQDKLESARRVLDLEARRIGRELAADFPTIDAIAETQTIKDMGSEKSITRIQLKLIEEGLEWSTVKDEQGNSISRLTSE